MIGRRQRVLMFPCPFQGHVNPMFQIAALLKSRGFAVTVLHTELNWPEPARWPDFDFVCIADGISDSSAYSMVALAEALNSNCESPFRAEMARLLSESKGHDDEAIACLIVDALLHRISAAAREMGLPALVLRTGSATNFNVALSFPTLIDKGYLPVKDSRMDDVISELPPFRVKDLIRVDDGNITGLSRFIECLIEGARSSSGIIFNTFEAIEGSELEKIYGQLHVPVFAVGPLHKLSSAAKISVMTPDYQCLQWLEKQDPGSVLYVSFGSMASVDEKQLLEMAWGLASSHQPFLWVVRPGSVRSSGHSKGQIELPREFEEEIEGRGLIVQWAPQLDVLSHPAIGGFWTHSGWNSTLESLCEGIPMLCTPFFSDQMGNARYASYVWKVGITLEAAGLDRAEIREKIKELMAEDEGEASRIRAKDMKAKAADGVKEDGSSSLAFGELLDHILSFGRQVQQKWSI